MPASADNRAGGTGALPTAGGGAPANSRATRDGAIRGPAPYRATTPPWLISYADLITLLLCFFILLISVTRVEQSRARPIMVNLAAQFAGVLDTGSQLDQNSAASLGDIRLVRDRVQALVANALPLARVRRTADANRLEIELPVNGFFRPGEDGLNALSRSRLQHLFEVMRQGAGATPFRLEFVLSRNGEAASRAAALGAETVADLGVRQDMAVSLDRRASADWMLLRVEFAPLARGGGGGQP